MIFTSWHFFGYLSILVVRIDIFFKKKVKKYPKRANELNSFSKNTGNNYFFRMQQINEKYVFNTATRENTNQINIRPRIHNKWPTSTF